MVLVWEDFCDGEPGAKCADRVLMVCWYEKSEQATGVAAEWPPSSSVLLHDAL